MSMAMAAVDNAPVAAEIKNFKNHFEKPFENFYLFSYLFTFLIIK